jgi:uncharacterized protein YqhQ
MELIGGKAGYNSVTFESETHSVTAKRKNKDIIVTKYKKEIQITKESLIYKIPFVRAYWLMLRILLNKSGLIILGCCMFLSYSIHNFIPVSSQSTSYNYIPSLIITAIFVLSFMFSNISYYHGAEHKVANDYDNNGKVSINTAIKNSRVSEGCGTNYFVGFMLITLLLLPLLHTWSCVVAWGVTYELMRSDNKAVKIIYIVGGVLQKYVFTKEPNKDQLEVAIKAFEALE